MTRVRVRGIYATALTRELLEAGFEVVQASPLIRRRFDAEFPAAEYDAAVETTDDRQGVGVSGTPDAVGDVATGVAETGLDALSWADPAPRGAVFDAAVTETLGSGAVVDLGDREGFLPFGAVDRRIEAGDRVRVQVHDPAPPWANRRPTVGSDRQVFGGIASLSTGVDRVTATGDEGTRTELARTTELLSPEVPEGWGVRWERGAERADVDAMDAALERAVDRATTLDEAIADASDVDALREVVAPGETTWVWFGRASRFALDDARRAAATTMAGHHRIKAADESASTAVDFAEAVAAPDDSFPTAAVFRTFGPREGDTLEIRHGKPDGRCFPLGRGEVTDRDPEAGALTLRREMTGGGTYDALGVEREAGDVAVTKFREGRWWYPTAYRSADGDSKGTYVNVCTPVELFPAAARYVDLHVDVIKHRDGRVERVDDDELDAAVDAGEIPEELAGKARDVAASVERALS